MLVAIIESLHRNLPLAFPEEGDGGAGSSSAVAVDDDDDVDFVIHISRGSAIVSHGRDGLVYREHSKIISE